MISTRLRGVVAALTIAACGPPPPPARPVKRVPVVTAGSMLTQARAAAQKGDVETADKDYQAAEKQKPDIETYQEHVDWLIKVRRIDAAVATSKTYYEAKPADVKGYHVYANALIAAGDFTTALDVTQQAIGLDANDATAHEQRGRALILDKKFDDGLDEIRKAVAISPNDAQLMVSLGSALQRAGKVDEAALQLREAIKLAPDDARAHRLLGSVLRDQLELDESQVELTKATKLDPNDARGWFELGLLQNKKGDGLGAEESLAQAVKLDPDDATNWYAYGEQLRYNDKPEQALDAYKKAMNMKPPHPKASAKYGLTLALAKKYAEAETFLTDAIRDDPKNAYNYENLGVVYEGEKKWKFAIDAYEKFVDLVDKADGDLPKVKVKIKELKAGHH
jgi:tetratricopeptide (TPR) repeat protein